MERFHHKEDEVMTEKRAFSPVFKNLYILCLCHLFGPSANSSPFQFLDLNLEETLTIVLW